jgi:hypothetical protein
VYKWIRGPVIGFLGSTIAGWVEVTETVVSKPNSTCGVESVDILKSLVGQSSEGPEDDDVRQGAF